MAKIAAIALTGFVGIGLLTGCSVKQIDLAATGATQVPGTGNLFRFCDGDTLIYFSNYGDGYTDEYEFIVYGGCAKNVPSQDGVQQIPDEEN